MVRYVKYFDKSQKKSAICMNIYCKFCAAPQVFYEFSCLVVVDNLETVCYY